MSQVIIYQNNEGAAVIMSPAPGHEAAELAATLPEGVRHFLVDVSALPSVGVAQMNVDFDLQTVVVKRPNLEAEKDKALSTARGIALDVRRQITTSASPERALSWVLKAVYGAVWQVNEAAANPLLASLSATAQAGFQLEADITGEDPVSVRDRSLEKAGLFFQANQLVEGMERLAEDRIPAAATIAELDTITAQLRALETQTLTKLAQITS
jgi:hypothetical protein